MLSDPSKDIAAETASREVEQLYADIKLCAVNTPGFDPASKAIVDDLIASSASLADLLTATLAPALEGGLTSRTFLEQALAEGFSQSALAGIALDWRAIVAKDLACKTLLGPLLGYKGFYAVCTYRAAHTHWLAGNHITALLLQGRACMSLSVDIHPAAELGAGLMIDHACGVVIGETTQMGTDCVVYQGATLGGRSTKDSGKRHPTIGNEVTIGSGALLVGAVKIGDGASVGAGSVVINDIPAGATAVGNPARNIER